MKQSYYNLADPDFLINPAPMLTQMRAEGPLVKIKLPVVGRLWATTTHAATSEVVKGNDRFFLTGQGAGLKKKGNAAMPWWAPKSFRALADNMLGKDDPEHRRLRKLVDQAFARRGIRDMRGDIAMLARSHLNTAGHGSVDIVPVFCRSFPLSVIAELLGVPDDKRAQFAKAAGTLGEFDGPMSIFRMLRAVSKLQNLVRDMVNDMRTNPQAGLIADLIDVEAQGDKLTENELVSMVFLLLFAGFETTTNLIAGSIIALDQNPDQKAWLFADFDGRIEAATEELCRFVSSVAGTKPRIAAHDTTIDGQALKKGDKIMALPVAANYDPAVFDGPEKLQLDRFPNPHLAFSAGTHFCLGMQLARVELQEALRALNAHAPNLKVADDPPQYARRPGHRALKALNVNLA